MWFSILYLDVNSTEMKKTKQRQQQLLLLLKYSVYFKGSSVRLFVFLFYFFRLHPDFASVEAYNVAHYVFPMVQWTADVKGSSGSTRQVSFTLSATCVRPLQDVRLSENPCYTATVILRRNISDYDVYLPKRAITEPLWSLKVTSTEGACKHAGTKKSQFTLVYILYLHIQVCIQYEVNKIN